LYFLFTLKKWKRTKENGLHYCAIF
jgi:hypothetical protein